MGGTYCHRIDGTYCPTSRASCVGSWPVATTVTQAQIAKLVFSSFSFLKPFDQVASIELLGNPRSEFVITLGQLI